MDAAPLVAVLLALAAMSFGDNATYATAYCRARIFDLPVAGNVTSIGIKLAPGCGDARYDYNATAPYPFESVVPHWASRKAYIHSAPVVWGCYRDEQNNTWYRVLNDARAAYLIQMSGIHVFGK
jgi:hypothetical protein